MRILHVLDHSIPLQSGYAFRTLAILEQQKRLGWQTFQVTSSKHYKAGKLEESVDGFLFYRTLKESGLLGKAPVSSQVMVIRSLNRRLEQLIPQLQPDIVHAHSPALNGVAALRAGKRHGIPVVYEIRAFWEDAAADHGTSREGGLRYYLTRALENYVVKRADAVTVICDGLRNDIVSRGVFAEKVTVIPNAVDLRRFIRDGVPDTALREKLGLAGKEVMGFIGSFYAYEGLSLLLDALPSLLARRPVARVLLVGGGPQEHELKSKVRHMGIEEQVVFVGRVQHDEVGSYYDLADVLVYPRLSMRLTELVTPLKPLEAMARGKIVVASDVGGHKELIEDAKTGYLFEAGSTEALATKLSQVFEKKERWTSLANEARRYVETERSWTSSVERYRNVYEAVTGNGEN